MFEPRIVCFICKWCTSAGADLAGTSRLKYRPNGVNIRFMRSKGPLKLAAREMVK